MFSSDSRYAKVPTYTVRLPDGRRVTAVCLPVRASPAIRGIHGMKETHRLDAVAAHYLGNPTAFWRLCDASDAVSPDALAARLQVVIPEKDDPT